MRSGNTRVCGRKPCLTIMVPLTELMENSVAQVSRYLDRIGAPESSQKHGLLMGNLREDPGRFIRHAFSPTSESVLLVSTS